MPYCVFHNCVNHSGHMNKSHGIIFHSFPSNTHCRQRWIDIIRRQKGKPEWTPSNSSRVCSLHFRPDYIFKNTKGMKRIIKGALPYCRNDYNKNKEIEPQNNETTINTTQDTNETVLQDEVIIEDGDNDDLNESQSNITVQNKKEVAQEEVEKTLGDEINDMAATESQVTPVDSSIETQSNSNQENPNGTLPLDKFKRRLVRAVARYIQQQKHEEEMWTELKKEIGCDCRMLWQHMRALTMKKLKRLLPANDLLANLKNIARFNATDWLLFDLILVHENINVISHNDGVHPEDDKRKEPQCLHDLFELVKEHNVENLVGDDLIEAWIRVTLQYNSIGRQCSPMMLQLRWYQLKELSRARFYNFWCEYRGNAKMLSRAMKIKPTALQADIARQYKQIVTKTYPEWTKLIEERRVILSEEFTLKRESTRKAKKALEENDAEVEVIEPEVETIELEVDSDEENGRIERKKVNSSKLDSGSEKSYSDGDALELDGLSDVETMHIPLKESDIEISENLTEAATNDIEVFPKITSVIGNVVEPLEVEEEQESKPIIEEIAMLGETNNDANPDTETKDADTVQSDLNDIDEILCEKSSDLVSLNLTQIKPQDDVHNEAIAEEMNSDTCVEMSQEQLKPITDNDDESFGRNKSIQSESDDEIDKLLEEKANNIGIEIPQIKADPIEDEDNEMLYAGEYVKLNEDMNAINKYGIDEEDCITAKADIIKKEKHDDGLDEFEFNDDQLEFVDDGIEFIEEINDEKNKRTDLNKEPSSESEDEGSKDNEDYPKIDLKLLMNPVVYTKKLDTMDVFKFTAYEFVNDKRVLEYALHESKPVDKLSLKDEDIDKFREQALRGYKTDGTQSDNDIVQTPTEEESTHKKIKITSWLLHKPKKRSYNPIQLCKNPDFNTRLKRLTTGFLSCTKNREFLKECKPLTIDLHKAFEAKLINGTMYLKSGDFKAAAVETVNTETVSVLPTIIPGQSMVFATPTRNISPMTSNDVGDWCKQSDRRKIINLPDIDQVRRLNQSLLTAEVTPIRIDSKVINSDSCVDTPKDSNDDLIFVQPIQVTPVFQVKNEPLESDLENKNELPKQPKKTHENVSAKELMAHKINEQIINISNEISEVDNNELHSKPVKGMLQKQDKIKSKQFKSNVEKPHGFMQPRLSYTPKYIERPSWTPKYPKNYVADSLLTLDTLVKILSLLNGNEHTPRKKKNKRKQHLLNDALLDSQISKDTNKQETTKDPATNKKEVIQVQATNKKKMTQAQATNKKKMTQAQAINKREMTQAQTTDKKEVTQVHNTNKNEMTHVQATNKQEMTQVHATNTNNEITSNFTQKTEIQTTKKNDMEPNDYSSRGVPRKKRRLRYPPGYFGIYCCWARERIVNITINRSANADKHGCNKSNCQCCCRYELVRLSIGNSTNIVETKRNKDGTKNNLSTIVLSDDDDNLNHSPKNNELVTVAHVRSIQDSTSLDINRSVSNVMDANLDNVAISIVLPTSTSTDSTTDTNANNTTRATVQSEENRENKSSSNISIELPKTDENLQFNKQISCKTVVHAAEGYGYNKRIATHNSTVENHTSSITTKSAAKNAVTSHNMRPTKDLKRSTTKSAEMIAMRSNESECTLVLNSSQFYKKPVKSPMYLGRRNILLCSLKKSRATKMPEIPVLPVLPYGVHFIMLPNGELTLSIDNGVQLDSDHLAALPSLMSAVQQQFLKSNISFEIPLTSDATQENNIITVTDESKSNVTNESSLDNLGITKDISTESENLQTTDKEIVCNSEESKKITSGKNNDPVGNGSLTISNDNETVTENLKEKEVGITDVECKKSDLETEMQLEKEKVNDKGTESLTSLDPSISSCDEDTSKNPNSAKTNPRTSLLSDLMEMSGISAEDTISDVGPPFTPLPPTIIPVTRSINDHTNTKIPNNISIAGPYSNLLSFEPTTPLNRLLNSVAQARPELNAITSFAELKYVYDNDGHFFKLDVGTGTISEIKVCIKKNKKLRRSVQPNTIIDLTEDALDSSNDEGCAEFQDIPQDKQEYAPIKPIKLFKAVHPIILNRKAKSILREHEIVYPKKPIRVNKQKRKQLLKVGNKYVLIDKENKEEQTSKAPVSSYLDSSFDSSDEEPLAKKCKRTIPNEEKIEESNSTIENLPEPNVSEVEDVECVPEIPDMGGDSSDLEMNSMDIEGVNPELHPVAFEEGSESDEDMCILGV